MPKRGMRCEVTENLVQLQVGSECDSGRPDTSLRKGVRLADSVQMGTQARWGRWMVSAPEPYAAYGTK
jgi:hypothetical protein